MGAVATLTLAVGGAELVVVPETGGAIARWLWRGRELLRDTSPAAVAAGNVRLMGCYPLVPFSNRIRLGAFTFAGTAHRLARNFGDHPHTIHGVGWQRPWSVTALVDRDHPATDAELESLELSGLDRCAAELVTGALGVCLLEYAHVPLHDDRDAWPFAFVAQQCVTLTPDFLALELTLENRDDVAMPAGFGWHPYFPKADAELDIEVAGMWHGDADRLPVRYEAPAPWPLTDWVRVSELELDHCFRRAADGRIALRWREAGHGIEIKADPVLGHLVVYTPPDRDFLAVEPVTHMNDAFNELARGNPDTGTILLDPGETIAATIILRPFTIDQAEQPE